MYLKESMLSYVLCLNLIALKVFVQKYFSLWQLVIEAAGPIHQRSCQKPDGLSCEDKVHQSNESKLSPSECKTMSFNFKGDDDFLLVKLSSLPGFGCAD